MYESLSKLGFFSAAQHKVHTRKAFDNFIKASINVKILNL